jgi:acyl-CoA synthetase (AMP-forming)/AMP-acid ligase II
MAMITRDFFWQSIESWSKEDPDGIALRFSGEAMSFQELDERSDRLAESFLSLGVEHGDRIATILPPRPEYVTTLLAANKIGAITVPLDVRFRPADLERFLSAAQPKVLVASNVVEDNPIAENLAKMAGWLGSMDMLTLEPGPVGRVFEELLQGDAAFRQNLDSAKSASSVDDGTLIIFTGGTTGVPKAALLSHRNVSTLCRLEAEVFRRCLEARGLTGRQRVLANLPPSHVGGTLELIGAQLVAGWEVILQEHWNPYTVLEAVQREKVPLLGAVPTMYTILLSLPDLDRFDLSSLELVVLSGEKVSLELLEGIRERICKNIIVGYGSTEAGAEVAFTEPDDDLEALAKGYVGKPLPGVTFGIVDENDRLLPTGEVGEILVGGPLTIRGYFRMPEEDQKGFATDGSCRTGDLGYLDDEGGLYLVGRKKHVIRMGSYTVMPSEVEDIVCQHADVATAAAVGAPHEIYGEVVWLFVAPRPGAAVEMNEILELCRRELADYKVPRRIIFRESLATSRVGKVNRAKLQEEVRNILENQDET